MLHPHRPCKDAQKYYSGTARLALHVDPDPSSCRAILEAGKTRLMSCKRICSTYAAARMYAEKQKNDQVSRLVIEVFPVILAHVRLLMV